MNSHPASAANRSLEEHRERQGAPDPQGGAAAPGGSPNSKIPSGRTLPTGRAEVGAPSPSSPPPNHAEGSEGAPHLFSGIPVRAIEDVMIARAEQIRTFGHTAEADRATPLWCARPFTPSGGRSFLWLISHQLRGAVDHAAHGHAHLEIVRRKLVKTAALILAAIDRIDAELAEDERGQL